MIFVVPPLGVLNCPHNRATEEEKYPLLTFFRICSRESEEVRMFFLFFFSFSSEKQDDFFEWAILNFCH